MRKNKSAANLVKAISLFGVAYFFYLNFESAIVDAATDTVVVTQDVSAEISISAPADVTMSPSIAGLTGGTGDGSATWTIITGNTTGFNMKIKASTSPALQVGGNSFADYTEASAGTPDYTWGIAAADSEFGFTVEPETVGDTVAAFRDNGSACNTGALNTSDKCWDGLATTDTDMINRTTSTDGGGESEIVKFKAQSGASHFQPEGTYTATITVTAVTN